MKLHSLWFFYICCLPFFPRKFDYFHLSIVEILIIHWQIFNGECIWTYLIKKKENPNYVMGSDTNSTDISDDIGEELYRIGQYGYKLSFLYIYLRLSNFSIIPQFYFFAIYLILYRIKYKHSRYINSLLMLLIFNTPGAPLEFCKK